MTKYQNCCMELIAHDQSHESSLMHWTMLTINQNFPLTAACPHIALQQPFRYHMNDQNGRASVPSQPSHSERAHLSLCHTPEPSRAYPLSDSISTTAEIKQCKLPADLICPQSKAFTRCVGQTSPRLKLPSASSWVPFWPSHWGPQRWRHAAPASPCQPPDLCHPLAAVQCHAGPQSLSKAR